MSDLSEFLLARLDEDYEVAYAGEPSPWTEDEWDGEFEGPREVLGKHGDVTAVCYYGGTYGHVLRFDPTRIIAEIEAKRRIVTECGWVTVMALLALPYADHPDYRQEWAS